VVAVKQPAAGVLDVEPRLGVEDRDREVHPDPAERVDHVGERVEVQLHVVVDRDREVLLDRGDQLARASTSAASILLAPVFRALG